MAAAAAVAAADTVRLPDPAMVVLVGASGSGKSTWARERFRAAEIVSSDELRGIAGSGPNDLDASDDAFALLEQIVDARLGRRLTTVVDTLGLDPVRRARWLQVARAAGLPAVAVVLATSPVMCKRRNSDRDRPVPAPVLAGQLKRAAQVAAELAGEGWDEVIEVVSAAQPQQPPAAPAAETNRDGFEIILQISRFPWGDDPARWLTEIALAADQAGFAGIALMDHLIQIPQVGRAWEPIPEPWVTLGLLAGLDTGLRLGTLVSPITFRPPGITAKAIGTLSALTGGRAFLGIGAGWWEREHQAFGLPFPAPAERLDALAAAIETIRALTAKGTKAFNGKRVTLPETTCYPRGDVEIIVGGGGERRTLRIAAELADGCNVPSDLATVDRKIEVLRRHCAEVGRDPAEVAVTVLDLPVIGSDRDDTWARVEKLRGRTPAATFAARHHAGTVTEHRARYAELAARGVRTVFLSLPDLADADDVSRLAALTQPF
ncbi:POSSIBLE OXIDOREDUCTASE [Alloactinosynnema sp. L-07]|uniref:LLM class flavin-dependent oxidoreductase n=1 Tax=Alloactinosynnema sp. L-07 TaxID=1653480 RepID=UPI00065F0183|nr:LLM class flavin-dependent oxidoreductase [Alloactinosynnema sp. L-07]CRK58995.1 POSSIBLE OXIDOREDUCTASE [Alloactinosynnema sp. L-07]